MSGMYLEVIGPTIEPIKMPTSSIPMNSRSMGVPLTNMYVNIEVIMLTNTANADVPATTYIGRPATDVRKGTYRKPPPTPMNAEIAAMTNPPIRGQTGLNENSTP